VPRSACNQALNAQFQIARCVRSLGLAQPLSMIRGKMMARITEPVFMRRSANFRPAKSLSHRLIVICVVAFAVLLLLLRMAVFVHRHGQRPSSRGAERGVLSGIVKND
jgi:hypothetical protein